MIPRAVHSFPGISLVAEETPEILARRTLMKTVQSVVTSNGVPYLQMSSAGLHSRSGGEKGVKKERKMSGDLISQCQNNLSK